MNIRHPTDVEKNEIEYYLTFDERKLYALYIQFLGYQIGRDPTKNTFPILPDAATGPFDKESLQSLRIIVCEQWDLCKQIDNPSFADSTNLIVAIADVIVAAGSHIPVPVLLTATTIVKIGVRKFCECGASEGARDSKQ